jgi:hypothetical protein
MDYSALMNDFAATLVRRGIARPHQIPPCTRAEVAEVQARQKVRLPESYRAFLLRMGRGAGSLLRGTHVFYPQVLDVRNGAEELLREDGHPFSLKPCDVILEAV